MDSLGYRLKYLRKKKDLSQKEAAHLIGISAVNLSRYEGNKRIPDKNTLDKIAQFYEVSSSYLYFGNENNHLDFLQDITDEEALLLKDYLKRVREKKNN